MLSGIGICTIMGLEYSALCRVLTADVPSDLVVEAGGLNFSLHKVPPPLPTFSISKSLGFCTCK
jgi:hypothetical protein